MKKSKLSKNPDSKMKIGVVGAAGRMGHEIARIAHQGKSFEAYLGVDSHSITFGYENAAKSVKTEKAKEVSVWIDFSSPQSLPDVLDEAIKNKTPVVCGTTGLQKKHFDLIKKASKKIPILWSSNMSIGVAILSRALSAFADQEGFDFQIEEFHHNAKKDNPSGTAITLQHRLEKVVGKKLPEPVGIRGGGIYGVHKVWAMATEEVLCFEHQALNRAVFARGALRAAAWLKDQNPGFYTIANVLE